MSSLRRLFKPMLAQIARELTEIAQGNEIESRGPTVKCWLVVVCFETADEPIPATPLSLCLVKIARELTKIFGVMGRGEWGLGHSVVAMCGFEKADGPALAVCLGL